MKIKKTDTFLSIHFVNNVLWKICCFILKRKKIVLFALKTFSFALKKFSFDS